jgi:aminoglycoside 6'-N-acetyltransferase
VTPVATAGRWWHAARVDVAFRRLEDADLPLLHRWLNEPGVVRWWEGDDVSWDAVVRDYGSTSTDPTEHWLALVDGRPVGWIQCYAITDYPDEDEPRAWLRLGLPATTAGIDYLVGDPADRGRGLGTAMIAAFTAEVVFGQHPACTHAAASPMVANAASWRALEKAGYRRVGDFDDPHGRARLMVVAREAVRTTGPRSAPR